eukprot:3182321-Amphidinium_carterae.1
MTGCITLERDADSLAPSGADTSAPWELQYLHRVIRAVPETGTMEIEAAQRHDDMILKELGIDAGVRGKDL